MARNASENTQESVDTAAASSASSLLNIVPPTITPAAGGKGNAKSVYVKVQVRNADGSTSEQQISRTDYIRTRWGQKVSRSQIAKELTELEGRAVKYQVVFAATKDLPGGPDKAASTAAPAAESEGDEE